MSLAREDQVCEEIKQAIEAANVAPVGLFTPPLVSVRRVHIVSDAAELIGSEGPTVWILPIEKSSQANTRDRTQGFPPGPEDDRTRTYERIVMAGVLVAQKLSGSQQQQLETFDQVARIREQIEVRILDCVPRAGMTQMESTLELVSEEWKLEANIAASGIVSTYQIQGLRTE